MERLQEIVKIQNRADFIVEFDQVNFRQAVAMKDMSYLWVISTQFYLY